MGDDSENPFSITSEVVYLNPGTDLMRFDEPVESTSRILIEDKSSYDELVSPHCQMMSPENIVIHIPRIIMQTGKSHDIPEHWKPSPKSIAEHMPHWKYVFCTDDDIWAFVDKHFPDWRPIFEAFPHKIQMVDTFRYMWLYVHGGVYMDLDFKVMMPIDSLFVADNEFYLVASGNIGSYITNSFMASKPGARIWLDILEEIRRNELPKWAIGKHMTVMNSTGPICVDRVVKRSRYVFGALPPSLLMACSICEINEGGCYKPGAMLMALPGSSWIGWDTHVLNFFLCRWRSIVTVLIIIVIILLLMVLWKGCRHVYCRMVN